MELKFLQACIYYTVSYLYLSNTLEVKIFHAWFSILRIFDRKCLNKRLSQQVARSKLLLLSPYYSKSSCLTKTLIFKTTIEFVVWGWQDNVNINCCTLIFIFTIALPHNVLHHIIQLVILLPTRWQDLSQPRKVIKSLTESGGLCRCEGQGTELTCNVSHRYHYVRADWQ